MMPTIYHTEYTCILHLQAKDGAQRDLPAAVEVVDVRHQRQRRRQPGVWADAASVHSPQQCLQGDRASPEGVRSHLHVRPTVRGDVMWSGITASVRGQMRLGSG